MQRYQVIKDYQTCYPDPIILKKGEEILYGKEDTQYPNWIFCKSIISKKEGWVPKQILSSPDAVSSKAIVLQDYSAHELTVNKGELLVGLKHLNGHLNQLNILQVKPSFCRYLLIICRYFPGIC